MTAISMYLGTGRRFLRMRRIPPWVEAIFWRGGVARSMFDGDNWSGEVASAAVH